MIYTVEGNTSPGQGLVSSGGQVAKKSYNPGDECIHAIYRPRYRVTEAAKIVAEAQRWIGYHEKASPQKLESFTENVGNKNYTRFSVHARSETGCGYFADGVAWCDCFKADVFILCLGRDRAFELLGGWSIYTPTSAAMLLAAGAQQVPPASAAPGDVIYFRHKIAKTVNGVKTYVWEICHVGIVIGNNGATTGTKVYKIGGYDLSNVKLGDRGSMVMFAQQLLIAKGYSCGRCGADGIAGNDTYNAIIRYQADHVAACGAPDGIIGHKTWASLLM